MYLHTLSPSRVSGAPTAPMRHCATLTAPARVDCVALLRGRASALLAAWALADEECDDAVLVVSELLTNAATHGRSHMDLTLTLYGHTLEILVTDQGPQVVHPALDVEDPDEHGRGLAIVAALAQDVDIHQGHKGRRVRVCLGLSSAGVPMPGVRV